MISNSLSTESDSSVYNIPAPIVRSVFISDLVGNKHPESWEGLIDTGAGRSAIPITICQQLQLTPRDFRHPKGFNHDTSATEVPRYYVRINVEKIGEFTLLVYGVRRPNILLGRDFLSELVFLLDFSKNHYTLGKHTFWSNLITPLLRFA